MLLKNLTIGRRLSIGFSIVIALLLMLAALAYSGLQDLSGDIRATNEDRYPKTVLVHKVKDELNEIARNMRNLLLLTDPAALSTEYANIAQSNRDIGTALEQLDRSISTAEGRALFDGIHKARAVFVPLSAAFLELSKAGDKTGALDKLVTDVRPAQREYFGALAKLLEWQARLMEDSGKMAQAVAASTKSLVIGLALAAALASMIVGFLVTGSITRPLAEAVRVARRVADGDLTSAIVLHSSDETGQLLQALKDMNVSLLGIVGTVRTGTDTIATASSQIAAGNLDLSSRTEQQASALEETASSMEELTATVKQNGDNARQANQLAKSASDVATKGGKIVARVVDTMGAINDASRKIVDIISVIDSIAFQTNILALNAAVEAARAGEQGRGFAVVASEVRNLAQRSATAAKEIKVLIGDSVTQVDIGAGLVQQAGATMDEMLVSVRRVTDIMGDITSAGREQEAGIEQINRAISEMDTVTQQNAALVEEAAAAAGSLQEQANSLASAVSVFRLHHDQAGQVARNVSAATPRAPRPQAPARTAARPMRLLAPVATAGEWDQF